MQIHKKGHRHIKTHTEKEEDDLKQSNATFGKKRFLFNNLAEVSAEAQTVLKCFLRQSNIKCALGVFTQLQLGDPLKSS